MWSVWLPRATAAYKKCAAYRGRWAGSQEARMPRHKTDIGRSMLQTLISQLWLHPGPRPTGQLSSYPASHPAIQLAPQKLLIVRKTARRRLQLPRRIDMVTGKNSIQRPGALHRPGTAIDYYDSSLQIAGIPLLASSPLNPPRSLHRHLRLQQRLPVGSFSLPITMLPHTALRTTSFS